MPKHTRQQPRGAGAADEEMQSVRFTDRDAFGTFCVALTEDQIHFELAGFQTVLLARTHLDHLPAASARLYRTYVKQNLVEQSAPVAAAPSRHLPTPEETEALLRDVAEHY